MILIAFRHGLRSSELCALKWDQFDMKQETLHVNRLKNGLEIRGAKSFRTRCR